MTDREIRIAMPRVVVIVVGVLLVANIAMDLILSSFSETALTEQVQARMLDVANSAADLLDGDAIADLAAEDVGSPAYDQAMDTLRAFQDSVDLSYIYCVREKPDGTFEFTVDPTVADPAEFGETVVYTEALGQAAAGTPAVDLVAYSDRWGSFYSAYSPVFDSKGNVASIVGADFSAAWYEEHEAAINNGALVNCLVSLLMAAIALLVVWWFSKSESRHAESLLRAVRYDELTGLPNMSHFFDLAERARVAIRKEGQVPVFLYIDLVDLKLFNHKHGFVGGDELMKSFAVYLSEFFGADRSARFGQDHFAAITDAHDLEGRLEAFMDGIADVNGGNSVPVRIGVYVDETGEERAGGCCDRAKVASVEGHAGYRSGYTFFTADMIASAEQRQHVIDNLDRAIEEGWIQVHYQPIVRTSTGKVCDEEALARWVDPKLGVFAPDEFIPALESAKLVYKLDLHVLEQVLVKMRQFADRGLFVVPASINLSRNDFESCDIVEEIRARVDASSIGRDKINIEITESAIGRDFEFMKVQVQRFHDLGFSVWMDDFGSEYSSLDYLQNLNFDLIKLDMRFMRQFDNGDKSKIILTELVKMAFGLGIETIVEGVETQEQVDFLHEIGCGKLQGYYFTKPLPLDDVIARYESGAAIGFENPDESDYYSALSRVNLYDVSSIARQGDDGLRRYFNSLPMAVVEATGSGYTIVRCNQPYRDFVRRHIGALSIGVQMTFDEARREGLGLFVDAVCKCLGQVEAMSVDEVLPSGSMSHFFIRRVAKNPVNGTVALALAVLSVGEE